MAGTPTLGESGESGELGRKSPAMEARQVLERLAASRLASTASLLALAATGVFLPAVVPLTLAAGATIAWHRYRCLRTMPLKMPLDGGRDPREPHPATGKPGRAQGMFYMGTSVGDGREVWASDSDCRQHFLVLGPTGAGKTETLLGMGANALAWGGGFTYVDGKGDVGLFARIYEMCRLAGREQDLLVVNFMNGSQDLSLPVMANCSHGMNPLRYGSPDALTQMLVALMDDCGGDGAMWRGRATAMMTGVMRALCYLRDKGEMVLTLGILRDHMSLHQIISLHSDPRLSENIRRTLGSYLTSLPGFQYEKGHKQAQTTLDQHGYLEMQHTKILGSLADVYGYVFDSQQPDVDIYDVVLNRRILLIMLPSLTSSGDEIANLGKVVVSMLKGMMGATLGSKLEGNWEDVVESRPTNSPTPYMVILDDCGFYTIEGMALMAAQARSLGFSMCYASQDIPSMKRLNEKEACSIIANTNTKVFMKSEASADGLALQAGQASVVVGGRDGIRADMFYSRPEQSDRKNMRLRLPQLVQPRWRHPERMGKDTGREMA